MMVGANVATPRPIPGVVPPASDTSSPQFGSSGGTEQGWWGPHTQQHDPGGQGLELFHGDADRRSSLGMKPVLFEEEEGKEGRKRGRERGRERERERGRERERKRS